MTEEPLISIAEAARRIGVARQVLHRQMQAGIFPRHVMPGGWPMVRLSEVTAGRRRKLEPLWGGKRTRGRFGGGRARI